MADNDRKELQQMLDRLTLKYNNLMRGRVMPTTRAISIKHQINALKERIDKLDKDAAERLALDKMPIDDVLEIIAIPLLADVMNDIVARVDGTLRRAGVQKTVFGDYVSQIRCAALKMVDTLDHPEESLPLLLDVDDTLVDAVRKKLMSFIKRRLNITK